MNSISRISLLGFLVAALAAPLQLSAQTNKASSTKPTTEKHPAKDASEKKQYIPFHGEIASVDKSARTFAVGKRVFQVNADTKFYKGESKAPATFDDGVAGEPVTGSYVKEDGGKLLAHSVYFKPKATAATTATTTAATTADKKKK